MCFQGRLVAISLSFFLSVPTTPAEELSGSLIEKVRRSCVEVIIKGRLRGGGAFVQDSRGKTYVLTAAHLFHRPGDTCVVVTADDRSHFASLSAYDLGHDLALLEVEPSLSRYGTLRVAAVNPSETKAVFNFGPALGRRQLVLPGSVAHTGITYTDFSSSQDYLGHYFVSGINPAFSSGGPWVNREGEIVGVQHGRLKGDEGAPSSGLSMVSPPAAVKALIEKNTIAATPGIGGFLWEIRTADRTFFDKLPDRLDGLVVNPVFKDRPLARAGIKPHDLILRCDGVELTRLSQLIERIRAKPAGSVFRLEVLTPGASGSREVILTTDAIEAGWR
jgi:S1-C subfamily serine protease